MNKLAVLRHVLSFRRCRVAGLLAGIVYWFVFAFSSGILFYYQEDISLLVRNSSLPNPLFYLDLSNFMNFYYSGIIWYPSGHLEIILDFGPALFSIVLSLLFSFNFAAIVYCIKFVRKREGLSGLIGLIPAFFSGGCCSIPVGFSIIGSFFPLAGLGSYLYFFNTYPEFVNVSFSLLMLVTLYYTLGRLAKLSCKSL